MGSSLQEFFRQVESESGKQQQERNSPNLEPTFQPTPHTYVNQHRMYDLLCMTPRNRQVSREGFFQVLLPQHIQGIQYTG